MRCGVMPEDILKWLYTMFAYLLKIYLRNQNRRVAIFIFSDFFRP